MLSVLIAYIAVVALTLPLFWRHYREAALTLSRMYDRGFTEMRRDLHRPSQEERIARLEQELGIAPPTLRSSGVSKAMEALQKATKSQQL